MKEDYALKKFRIVATKDVGYQAIIEAKNCTEAWEIARGNRLQEREFDWVQTDDGHHWTLERIHEWSEEENDYV